MSKNDKQLLFAILGYLKNLKSDDIVDQNELNKAVTALQNATGLSADNKDLALKTK